MIVLKQLESVVDAHLLESVAKRTCLIWKHIVYQILIEKPYFGIPYDD